MIETPIPASTENVFLPHEAVIKDIIEENSTIKTYIVEFTDREFNSGFTYMPGQFVMLSVPDQGEAPISISSPPTRPGAIHLSVRKAGRLTSALHDMTAGQYIGIRGPYGRPFPMQELQGRDLLFVAGGIGLAPLRSVISFCLDSQGDYGAITLLYGSRTPLDIAFQADIDSWQASSSVDLRLSVDVAEPGWDGHVGLVTTLLDDIHINGENTSALLCGPPVMIDVVTEKLEVMGLSPENIITTMERNMKCGVGLCGHCHMEGVLVCKDGPVFSAAELKQIEGAA